MGVIYPSAIYISYVHMYTYMFKVVFQYTSISKTEHPHAILLLNKMATPCQITTQTFLYHVAIVL